MDINFIETYVPAIEELDRQAVLDQRDSVQRFVNVSFPDIVTHPSTVVGDLLVTPLSYILASFQQGVDRLLSDMCLENVANGIVYNCDFVQSYVKNFGVSALVNYPSSGVVRIVFSKLASNGVGYILDRSTQFKIGEYIYNIYLPNDGGFICFNTDAVITDGINGSRMKQLESNQFFCDVPVVGVNGQVDVGKSEDVLISQYIPEILSITTLLDFSTGLVNKTIENLAKDAQTTIYSASLNTRGGAILYVRSSCPFIESVFAVKSGDRELLRDYAHTPGYGISEGCMDVYARSNAYEFTEKQVVKLVRRTYEGSEDRWFEGEWDYEGQPYHVESVTHSSVPLLQLEYDILAYNDGPSMGAKISYTKKERLFIRVKDLVDNGNSIFNPFLGSDGETYAYFVITYQTDPLLPSIALTMENPFHQPINSSIYVRGFIPVIIENFLVVYVKKHGVIPDLQKAEDDIKIYLGLVGAPNGYTEAEISRIMGEAGVRYMKRIDVQARVQWSVANYVVPLGMLVQPEFMWDPERVLPVSHDPVIRDSDGLRVTYPNIGVDIPYDCMYSCSPRNIRYFVLENAIKFKEVIDV